MWQRERNELWLRVVILDIKQDLSENKKVSGTSQRESSLLRLKKFTSEGFPSFLLSLFSPVFQKRKTSEKRQATQKQQLTGAYWYDGEDVTAYQMLCQMVWVASID